MLITYFGLTCFRLQSNGLSLLIDPFSDKSGLKLPRMQNDIILYSHQMAPQTSSEKAFIVSCPGEYEIKGCFIYGVSANHQENKLTFLIELEGIKLAHLGVISQIKFTQAQLDKLEDVDILMIPVGGNGALSSEQAAEAANELEPRLIIPMYYQLPGLKLALAPLDKFKKELGAKSETVDKLKIVKKELPEDETKLVIINPSK